MSVDQVGIDSGTRSIKSVHNNEVLVSVDQVGIDSGTEIAAAKQGLGEEVSVDQVGIDSGTLKEMFYAGISIECPSIRLASTPEPFLYLPV